ncbi:MAG: hypothetical protein O3A18_03190 [Planctomycetota bacterium]|jgi:hypothetical protein|nr:hypothetical protein [Planctomycetota bacterium]
MPRFVLLEHTGHPDDPTGRHFDLLLEEPEACQTWRLAEVPVAGGEGVAAEPLPPHRLAWLDIEADEVSGGRGFARRVDSGSYQPTARPPAVDLAGALLAGRLDLVQHGTRYTAHLTPAP